MSNTHKLEQQNHAAISLIQYSRRSLTISISGDDNELVEGFDLGSLPTRCRFGLLGIAERVALLGGRMHMQNKPDGGLLIQVEIPHPRS